MFDILFLFIYISDSDVTQTSKPNREMEITQPLYFNRLRLIIHAKTGNLVCIPYISGSQTFVSRVPLKIFKCIAKHKILICIGIDRPLELISRTTRCPQSRLLESLPHMITLSLIKKVLLDEFFRCQ